MTTEEILGKMAAGAIGLLLAAFQTERKEARRYRRAHQELVDEFNQFEESARLDGERTQDLLARYETKLQQQQDMIDQLTGQLNEVRRFHYN